MDNQTRRMFKLAAYISLAVIVAVVVYGIVESALSTGTELAIGIVLVNVEWPFPFFAKPVSYFSVACVVLFYSGLRLWEGRISKWSPSTLHFLQLVGFTVAFASAYEVLYNFMIWGSFLSVDVLRGVINPDIVVSPSMPVPWNLDFATKAFSALFVISGYTVYFIRRITHNPLV